MTNPNVQVIQKELEDNFAAFEKEHPEVAEAMKIMHISMTEYLQALAAIKGGTSISGNASNSC